MRRLLHIIPILALCALIFACSHDKQADKVIDNALAVMEEDPDSALSLLNNIKGMKKEWPKSQRMRYELVYAQAQNKAFIPFTTDSVVLNVVNYYDNHGSDNERMLANYMVGCAYRDLGDAPTAIKYFNQAVKSSDISNKDCDLSTLMRIHSQMAELYHSVETYDNAWQEDLMAENIAWQICDTLSFLHLKWSRACSLFDAQCYDQSLCILDSIVSFVREHKFPISPDLLYPIRICERFENNDAFGAGRLLDSYEQALCITPQSPDEHITNIGYYHLKGRYYNMVGLPDSAIYMFHRQLESKKLDILSITEFLEIRENYYRGLLDAYSLKHQSDSMEKYARLYCQFNDSTSRVHASENVINAQSLYNYSKAQEEALVAQQKASQMRFLLFAFTIFALIAGFSLWLLYRKRIKHERQKQIEHNIEYQSLRQQFENSNQELQLYKTDAEQFKKAKETENEELRKALSLYQADNLELKDWNEERNILSCEVAEHLHALSAKGKQATQDEFEILKSISKSGFPSFFSKITEERAGLTDKEVIVCTLIRFRFIATEIAILTGLSPQRITNLKATINKKLFNTQGAKTLGRKLIVLR